MDMIPLVKLLPEIAVEETRTVFLRSHQNIPDGEYAFLELYCDDKNCDCRRVAINVISQNSPRIWASLSYGWESLDFYHQWSGDVDDDMDPRGPYLDPLNPQSSFSEDFLLLFKRVIEDQKYVDRLKTHYQLFKSALKNQKPSNILNLKQKRKRWRLK